MLRPRFNLYRAAGTPYFCCSTGLFIDPEKLPIQKKNKVQRQVGVAFVAPLYSLGGCNPHFTMKYTNEQWYREV